LRSGPLSPGSRNLKTIKESCARTGLRAAGEKRRRGRGRAGARSRTPQAGAPAVRGGGNPTSSRGASGSARAPSETGENLRQPSDRQEYRGRFRNQVPARVPPTHLLLTFGLRSAGDLRVPDVDGRRRLTVAETLRCTFLSFGDLTSVPHLPRRDRWPGAVCGGRGSCRLFSYGALLPHAARAQGPRSLSRTLLRTLSHYSFHDHVGARERAPASSLRGSISSSLSPSCLSAVFLPFFA